MPRRSDVHVVSLPGDNDSPSPRNRSRRDQLRSTGADRERTGFTYVELGPTNRFADPRGDSNRPVEADRGRQDTNSEDDVYLEDEDEDEDEEGHAENGVVTLPSINPYTNGKRAPDRTSSAWRNTSQPAVGSRRSGPAPTSADVRRAGAVPANSRLLAPVQSDDAGSEEFDVREEAGEGEDEEEEEVAPRTGRARSTPYAPQPTPKGDRTGATAPRGNQPGASQARPSAKETGFTSGVKRSNPRKNPDEDGSQYEALPRRIIKGPSRSTQASDDDGEQEPNDTPVDRSGNKGKGKEGLSTTAGGKGIGESKSKGAVHVSTSDSWSGEVGRPEEFGLDHHHHHHRHRPKREYPPVNYVPDPDLFTSDSNSDSSLSDSSSSVGCDCPGEKHHRRCRFWRERERDLPCGCPNGKHHRDCRFWRRRYDRELEREHHARREYRHAREYGFDCGCEGGFHHQLCPVWRRGPHHHHHPKPWAQPPWWPYPFPPMITAADHKRNPFGEPLYANIPELPSLFDQVKDAYYTLPVPPTNLLRDLQEAHRRQVPKESAPVARVPPSPATLLQFASAVPEITKDENYLKNVPVILYQQLQPYYVDMVYNRLQSMVQVRFAERKGEKIVNRVHIVQRYRTAWGAVMNYRPKLDVDIVLPGDFVLRRWCIKPDAKDEDKPRTISKALGLNPTTVMRGEVSQDKLDWVINAVWDQLTGQADGFIFPGGNAEALQYIGSFEQTPPRAGANRIKLQSVSDKKPIWINLFVKVAIRLNGQDLVVGVDQASAVSENKYQLIKMYHTPNGPLGESPLGPIEQTALILLGWWKCDTKHGDPPKNPGGIKIRASHFSLALKACHELDPTDELYISPGQSRERFSMKRSVAVALKIAKYLKNAYSSPVLVCASTNAQTTSSDQAQKPAMEFLFSLPACGILEAVYTQMVAVAQKPELKELIDAFDALIKLLEGTKGGDDTSAEGEAKQSDDAENVGGVVNSQGGGSGNPSLPETSGTEPGSTDATRTQPADDQKGQPPTGTNREQTDTGAGAEVLSDGAAGGTTTTARPQNGTVGDTDPKGNLGGNEAGNPPQLGSTVS